MVASRLLTDFDVRIIGQAAVTDYLSTMIFADVS
jgi:hypothetical protein